MSKRQEPYFAKCTAIYVEQDGADFHFAQSNRIFEYGDADDCVTAPFKVPDFDYDMAEWASSWFINWCRENNATPYWCEDHHRNPKFSTVAEQAFFAVRAGYTMEGHA